MNADSLHSTFDLPRGKQRFRELCVYISKKCERDPSFGAVKINKILYYSDFRAFERFGQPLTGFKYVKLPQGPAPIAMVPIRNELIGEGAIRVEHEAAGGEYTRHRWIALRAPVMDHFTADEVTLVNEVIEELWGQSAQKVSDASHDVRWRCVNMKDPMPYELAFLSNDPVTDDEDAVTKDLAQRFGWG